MVQDWLWLPWILLNCMVGPQLTSLMLEAMHLKDRYTPYIPSINAFVPKFEQRAKEMGRTNFFAASCCLGCGGIQNIDIRWQSEGYSGKHFWRHHEVWCHRQWYCQCCQTGLFNFKEHHAKDVELLLRTDIWFEFF